MKRWGELVAGLHRTRFGDRDALVHKGGDAEAVAVLVEGAVELLHPSPDGSSVLVKILVAPTLFGVIEAIAREPSWLESVRGLGDGSVVWVPRAQFQQIVESDAAASYECLRDLGLAFAVAARHEPSRLHQVDAVLANALVAYVDACGEPWDGGMRLRVKRTQADFAAAIGASERSVNKALTEWRERGLIDKNDARYIVLDRRALIELAGELAGSLVHRFGGR
jgi:CRP/FNR family cyclic AMP-dependent transcriptional regulator